MGRSVSEPRGDENPEAFTVFASRNVSTKACFPEQLVSAQESKPRRQPNCNSVLDNVG